MTHGLFVICFTYGPDLVFGKGAGLYALWISIGLIAYVYSLSRSTTIYCMLWAERYVESC